MIRGIVYNQFGIIQVLQRSPIPQTGNWLGLFLAVSYSKVDLVHPQIPRPNISSAFNFKNDLAQLYVSG